MGETPKTALPPQDRAASLEDQIVLTLIYLRHHINFQLLGLQFQVSESTANSTFNYWQSLLREALPASLS
ncbi:MULTISPECIES: transposase family protein [Moorena]|uniref:Transposase Helix-turn-helix domain-containing protein n=1 Tax=Moorena producens 3L TaxID=489825 RepID=F4XY41_9CYAN|nr:MULTISPECIES: transposase family protein [Moorena]EGJ30438.1 hypothetical protein LYNGBM3L_50000 [Moorena producens 3L]